MNFLIASKLESTEREIKGLDDTIEKTRISSAIKAVCSYLRGIDDELAIYTASDLELELFRARAEDISKNRELTIRLEEFRREISTLKSRSSYFESQCNDYLRCIKQYQTEIASLSLTVHKHQKNFEASSTENAKMKVEIQELKTLNSTMADSISEDRRSATIENATMKAELDTLQKSTKDYKAAFVSTKKKLQLAHQRHMNLLGMAEPLSPMGQELDSTTVSWTEEGLSAQQSFGSLLSTDGIMRTYPIEALRTAATTMSLESHINMSDLSDEACLL